MTDVNFLSKEGLDRYDNKMKNYIGIELTKAEYDQLSEEEKNKGTYWITDYSGSGGSSNIELDKTLSIEGKAADAKAVGDAINVRCNADGYLEVYVNGVWKQTEINAITPKTYLYNNGDQYVDITGGYEALGISNSSSHIGLEKAPVLTMESTHMNIKWTGTYQYTMGGVLNKKAIDLTDANKLYVAYNASHNGTIKTAIRFIIGTKNTTPLNNLSETIILDGSTSNISDTIEIDVSSISGAVYYGVLFMTSDGGNIDEEVNISSIWTE